MSELDDAIARLDRAVARLEAAPGLTRAGDGMAAARIAAASAAEEQRVQQLTAAIVNRVEAALDRIGQALGEDG
jgi:hypothetical protein